MSRWLKPTANQIVTAMTEKELEKRLEDKAKQGYVVVSKSSHYTTYGIRKYTAVVKKVS